MAKKSDKIEEVKGKENGTTVSKLPPSNIGVFSKADYWKRRTWTITDKDGNSVSQPLRGQGNAIRPVYKPNTDSKAEVGFTNDGELVYKNREYRRRKVKIAFSNRFTKRQKTRTEIKKLRKLGRR